MRAERAVVDAEGRGRAIGVPAPLRAERTQASNGAALAVAVVGLQPDPVTAFQARGGAVFLWWRWLVSRRGGAPHRPDRRSERVLVAIPVAFTAAVVATNVQPLREWSRSLDAFRAEVDRTEGVVFALDVLPAERRDVLWGWTASSLSLIVRANADARVLVDRDPTYVPFPAEDARAQLADDYVWGG